MIVNTQGVGEGKGKKWINSRTTWRIIPMWTSAIFHRKKRNMMSRATGFSLLKQINGCAILLGLVFLLIIRNTARWLAASVFCPYALWGYLVHYFLIDEGTNLPPSFLPSSLTPSFHFFLLSIHLFLSPFLSVLSFVFSWFFFFDPELQELIFIFLFLFAKLSLWECLFWCTPLLLMLTERYNCRYLSVSVNLIICTKDILSNTF